MLSTIQEGTAEPKIARRFRDRLAQGRFSREENPGSHFCVYFAAHDVVRRLVFVGHHKKSGLWLFNGGHLERGESPLEAARREIGEEWGLSIPDEQIGPPRLLTITQTVQSSGVPRTVHFDVWYFVAVDSSAFAADPAALALEFQETGWLTPAQARARITDPNTLSALELIESTMDGRTPESLQRMGAEEAK
jgi:8-oxo-dGTP diphosphatase